MVVDTPQSLISSVGLNVEFLRANNVNYEWLVKRIQGKDLEKEPEAVLGCVAMAAQFAATFHPGRFADGAIENPALEIGAKLGQLVTGDGGLDLPMIPRSGRRRVLQVASSVLGIGGHSRMLHHWIRNDQSSCHSLLLTSQGDMKIPGWLSDTVRSSGGHLVALPPGSGLCHRAMWLRQMAKRSADLVVLHHGGSDVVPTVAFAPPDGPPVAVLNHADHGFWLGSSVADIVINLRTAGSEHTRKRRFVSANVVLPIPLAEPPRHLLIQAARRKLGIPQDQVMLLSIARAEKYRPCGPYNFVLTAGRILDRRPAAHLYAVGESPAGIAPYLLRPVHERLHFVGTIEDPSLYRAAADIYLETFPFGSQTALLEAALSGLPVVTAYAPLFPLLVANDDAIQEVIPNPLTEQEYVEQVDQLIQKPEWRVRLGKILRERLLVDHVREGWLHRLAAIYKEMDGLTHAPKPIPLSLCSMAAEEIGLSHWHVNSGCRTYFSGNLGDMGTVFSHAASVATYAGNFAEARRFAWRAVRQHPYGRAQWHLFTSAVLGRSGRLIRRLLFSLPSCIPSCARN
jgi:glycosyltransferase involved in cell wall biosynthesis